VKAKDIRNILNKNNVRKLHKSRDQMAIQVQDAFRTPNREDQNGISPCHTVVKTLSIKTREEH
jgi:hypothetical protein